MPRASEAHIHREFTSMGFISSIKNNWRKSEAAVVVQNLLEHQAACGMFEGDPAQVANKLVGDVWICKPDVFEGKFGQRPHKISVAASALAMGLDNHSSHDQNFVALSISLGNILSEIERNGRLYPLNSLDMYLIEISTASFLHHSKKYL